MQDSQRATVQGRDAGTNPYRRSAPIFLIAVVIAMTAAGSYRYYADQRNDLRDHEHKSLAAIASLKANAIAAWLDERRGDTEALGSDPLLAREVARLFGILPGPLAGRNLLTYMEQMAQRHQYRNILLLDKSMSVRLSVNEETGALAPELLRAATEAVTGGKAVLSDLYLDSSRVIRICAASPIVLPPNRTVIGAVVIRINPERSLYREIEGWPGPSRTAETLLVRRDGARVVFLNELRHRHDTALRLSIPVTRTELPAAQAVLGFTGVFEGVDYRGAAVLAAMQPIRHSPWFVVAKIDAEEVYGPAGERAHIALGVSVLLVCAVGATLGWLWRRREARFYRQRYQAELERLALVSHFEYLHRYANDIILLVDESGRITEANERATTTYGWSRDQLIGMDIRNLRDPGSSLDFEQQWRLAGEQDGLIFETIHRRADGSTVPVEVSSRIIDMDGRLYRQSIIRDITERKRSEQELHSAHDELAAIHANAPVALMVVDEELNVQKVSDLAAGLYRRDHADGSRLHTCQAIGCIDALANPEKCGSGTDCPQCPIRLTVLDSVRRGERHESIEAWTRVSIDGREQRRCLLVSVAPMRVDGTHKALVCAQDITDLRQAEVELEHRRELVGRQAEMINLSHDAIVTSSPDRIVTGWNAGAAEMYGWTEAEAVGKSIHELLQTSTRIPVAEIDAILQQVGRWDGKLVHVRKDGRRIVAESRQVVTRDAYWQPAGILEINRDVTDQERTREELVEAHRRISSILESVSDGFNAFDEQSRYTYVNTAGARMFGMTAQDLLGKSLWEIFPHAAESAFGQAYRQCAEERIPLQVESLFPDPLNAWLEVRLYPTQNGVSVFYSDISERKRAEAEKRANEERLQQLNAELEQRVRARTAQLETANRELEAFAYSASHDLRAPLRGIDGWSLALLDDYGENLDEKARGFLNRVRSETQRMGVLIDALLRLSRLSRSEMQWQAVDLTATVSAIAGRLRETEPARDFDFAITPGLTAEADSRLIEVALTNLLSNAVKYTGPRSRSRIEFGETQQSGKRVFYVRDNGVGFDMAYAGNLFAPFQRLHATAEFPGTGIGLATVQRILHRHGGRIWAEAAVDRGATFYFTLGGSD